MSINADNNLEKLEILISEIKTAHWGGYRTSFEDEDIEVFKWALEKLKQQQHELNVFRKVTSQYVAKPEEKCSLLEIVEGILSHDIVR